MVLKKQKKFGMNMNYGNTNFRQQKNIVHATNSCKYER